MTSIDAKRSKWFRHLAILIFKLGYHETPAKPHRSPCFCPHHIVAGQRVILLRRLRKTPTGRTRQRFPRYFCTLDSPIFVLFSTRVRRISDPDKSNVDRRLP